MSRGSFQIELPGGISLDAVREMRQEMGNKRSAWIGHARDNRGDRVVIGVSGDAVAATFSRRGKLFKLKPRSNGTHVISEVLASDPAPELDPIPVPADESAPFAEPDEVALDEVANTGAIIDVLIAYTAEVANRYGVQGAEALAIQAVAEANQAYANSGILTRLNLLEVTQTDYIESGDMASDLTRLRGTSDGYMDDLHTLRDSLGADIVSLIEYEPRYCGYAYRMISPSVSFASSAFSVVHEGCATGYYSFAHEIGHNQGVSHNPENATSAIYDYAFGHQDPLGNFRTVMAYNCTGSCKRIDYFSNPDVYYGGEPTGVDGLSDNARAINNTSPTVASFRQQVVQAPPLDPSELNAAAVSEKAIELSWLDNADNESGYRLERSTEGGVFTQIASLPADSTAYLDDDLVAATFYTYRVFAWNDSGQSNYSNEAITATEAAPVQPPAAPTELTAMTIDKGSIELNWNDRADNELGFRLERSTNGEGFSQIASLSANTSSYLHNNLVANTQYTYRIQAWNSDGSSSYSNYVIARTASAPIPETPASAPDAPVNLDLASTTPDSITLSWTDRSDNEAGFRIERRDWRNDAWEILSATSENTTTYIDTELVVAQRYEYRVFAYNGSGQSEYSNVVNGLIRSTSRGLLSGWSESGTQASPPTFSSARDGEN